MTGCIDLLSVLRISIWNQKLQLDCLRQHQVSISLFITGLMTSFEQLSKQYTKTTDQLQCLQKLFRILIIAIKSLFQF